MSTVLRRPNILALLSGLLAGATTITNLPTPHLHCVILICFMPLWAGWERESSYKNLFLQGWIFQFVLTLIAFNWLAFTINEYSQIGAGPSFGLLILYCSLGNLHFPLAGVCWLWLFPRKSSPTPLRLIALGLLTALFSHFSHLIFPWNFGYSWLYQRWPAFHLAEWIGFQGLSSITLLLNAIFTVAIIQWRKPSGKWALLAGLSTFIALNVVGAAIRLRLPNPDQVANILLIQPNLQNQQKKELESASLAYSESILEKYFSLTKAALAVKDTGIDFALWPENAFPDIIGDSELTFRLSRNLKKFLRTHNLNLVTGGYGFNENEKVTNSLFAISNEGTWTSPPYEKLILLPFGEFIPGEGTFPFLKNWLPAVHRFGRGHNAHLLQIKQIHLGPQICYEALFPSISRNTANLGAQILINVTNDSWYGKWQEPWQHLYITLARAIETRRPLVRVTNTGISAAITAKGEILTLSPIGKEWSHIISIPYLENPPNTLFQSWGYWIDSIASAIALLVCIILRRSTQPGKR